MPNRLPVRHCPAHAVIPPVLRTIGFISTYVPESGLIPFHPIRILLKENRKSAQIGISHSADIACAPTVVPVGIGQGAAADLGYGSYDKWKTVSQLPADLKWTVDNDTEVYVTMSQNDWNKYLIEHGLDFNENPWFDPNTGPAKTLTSANPILAEAMSFAGPPPVYTPSYHTYVVRTADGKRYFKIQIISWYNADSEIGDSGGQISYYCDELN